MSEVKVYSFIGKKRNSYDTNEYMSGSQFAEALQKAAAGDSEEIKVSVNSGGGSVTDGWAMIAAMQKCTKPVVATIDGFAASMGYYVCLGAKKITAAQNSIIMLHSVQGSASGNPDELRKEAEVLDKFNQAMATLLVARTGLTTEEVIAKYLGAELFLTAQEALDLKLIDAIENYDAENIPAIEANMTFEQVEFKYAALHQETNQQTFIAGIMAKVKETFGLIEKENPEPQAIMLNEKETECLGSLLWSARYLADESAHAVEYTSNPEIMALLENMRKASAAFVVEITNKLYGENTDAATVDAKNKELFAAIKNKRIAEFTAKAEQAIAVSVAQKMTEKDAAIASAQTEIENLKEQVTKLKDAPADDTEVVVRNGAGKKKPLTKAELEEKVFT